MTDLLSDRSLMGIYEKYKELEQLLPRALLFQHPPYHEQ